MEGFTAIDDDPQVIALTARSAQLTTRIAALQSEVDSKRLEALTAFRDLHAKKFASFNWKAALAGSPVDHAVKVAGVAVYTRLSTGATAQKISSYLADLTNQSSQSPTAVARRAEMMPVTPIEAQLLARIVAVEAGTQRLDLLAESMDNRLTRIRMISEPLLRKVVDECELLESWLNAQMELDSGNC